MSKLKREAGSYLKLNSYKFGLAGGIIGAGCVILITLCGVMGWVGGLKLWTELLASIYSGLGYKISWVGMILGGIYGFVDCFIITWIFALIYNRLR